MPSGSELESRIAVTGMPSLRASATAICSLLVSITNSMLGRPPISLMPPSERSRQAEQLLLLEAGADGGVQSLLDAAHALDRTGDGLPVGQRAAKPAMVDEILGAALGGRSERLLRLALGADEQDAAASGRGIAQCDQSLMQQRHGLREVDDVNVIAGAVDVGRHLRIPALGAMAEMGARFQQLTHGEFWQSHEQSSPSPVSLTRGDQSFAVAPALADSPDDHRTGMRQLTSRPTLRARNGRGYREPA